ncbi:MAG: Rieske 2Fe-2S domain-containing protein, partial [Cyanobacteria bacterium J06573_2]
MKFEYFWYVAALSNKLKPNKVISRKILGEWLVIFRGIDGKPVALQ